MASYVRKAIVTAVAGTALGVGVIPPANAQPVIQDGLVNVTIGDITVTDTVDVAASLAVQACDLADVGSVAVGVLARAIAVDRSGRSQTICENEQGPVTISNN